MVKKERHGRTMRAAQESSHTLQRRLLTLHKPTEQKLIDNKPQSSLKVDVYLHLSLLGMTRGNGMWGKKTQKWLIADGDDTFFLFKHACVQCKKKKQTQNSGTFKNTNKDDQQENAREKFPIF